MPNLVNSVIAGVLIFFALLAAFWYAVEVRSDEEVEVTQVEALWGPVDADGTTLKLGFLLENHRRTEAEVQRVGYSVSTGGIALAQGSEDVQFLVGPGKAQPIELEVQLPPDFAPTWWDVYAANDEKADLVVSGDVTVVQSVRRQQIPFEWRPGWEGSLASDLAGALEGCPEAGAFCLDDTEAQWDGAQLAMTLRLANEGEGTIEITNTTVVLTLGGTAVGRGGGEGSLDIPDGTSRSLALTMAFIDGGLTDWWKGHVAACESSSSDVVLNITYERTVLDENGTAEQREVNVEWPVVLPDFETDFVCREP